MSDEKTPVVDPKATVSSNGKYEMRQHRKYGYVSDFGKSTVEIVCPFCGKHIRAYVWSLAGKGKKCYCGVLHGSWGVSMRKMRVPLPPLPVGDRTERPVPLSEHLAIPVKGDSKPMPKGHDADGMPTFQVPS